MNLLQAVLGSTDALGSLLEFMWDATVEHAQTPEGKEKLNAILRDVADADNVPESREGTTPVPPPDNGGLGQLTAAEIKLLDMLRDNPALQSDINEALGNSFSGERVDFGKTVDPEVPANVLAMANRKRE